MLRNTQEEETKCARLLKTVGNFKFGQPINSLQLLYQQHFSSAYYVPEDELTGKGNENLFKDLI